MKVRALFLTLFLTICFSVSAQDSYEKSITEYLTVNGSVQQYEGIYTKMFDLLKNHFSKSQISEATWQSLQSNKAESLQEIQKMLGFAYRNHFSENDIKKMTAFYSSDVGKQLSTNAAELSATQNQEVAEYNESTIGRKIAKEQQGLTKDVGLISSNWSRDLYMDKTNALKAKGFIPDYEMKATLKKSTTNKLLKVDQ
jgi:hypothetical protein